MGLENELAYEREIRELREENARLRWVVKGAHGALTDAATVVVPGALDGDLAPAIRQITRERDEARVTKDLYKERAQEAWAEVARLEGLILGWALTPEDEFEGRDALIDAAKEIEARRIRGEREGRDGKA